MATEEEMNGTAPAEGGNNGGGFGGVSTQPPASANDSANPEEQQTPPANNQENTPPATPPAPGELVEYPGLPDGITEGSVEAGFIQRLADVSKKAGLSAEVYKSVLDGVMEMNAEVERSMGDQRLSESEMQCNQLKQAYGGKFAAVMESANNALTSLAAELGFDPGIFLTPELRNNDNVIKLFAGLNQKFREAGFAPMASASVANAQQEAMAIMTDPNHPDYKIYSDPSHPRWQDVNGRVTRLLAGTV